MLLTGIPKCCSDTSNASLVLPNLSLTSSE